MKNMKNTEEPDWKMMSAKMIGAFVNISSIAKLAMMSLYNEEELPDVQMLYSAFAIINKLADGDENEG